MIDGIYDNNLCNFCGTCFSACPQDAISFVKNRKNFEFLSDPSKCIKCGTCLRVCPGIGVDFKKLNNFVFQKFPQNKLLGIFKSCYIASSRNKKIRYEASSGGVISSFLVFLLKEKLIDGALVTSMNEKNPLEPRVFIARTKNEILSAKGSKYLPVPLNIGIKKITEAKRNDRFAVVGLPCHIEGIRKMQMVNPQLQKKIFISLGLFCGQTVNFSGTEFLLKFFKIEKPQVKKISFRGNGWPGALRVETVSYIKEIPYFDYFSFFNLGFFIPNRCFLCVDFTNEFADISFGDGWLPDIMINEKCGKNIVITRTKLGESLFRQAENAITFYKVSPEKIVKSMWWRFYSKKNLHYFISKIAGLFDLSLPKYDISYGKKFGPFGVIILVYLLNSFISDRFLNLFLGIPSLFWKMYKKSYEFFYLIFSSLKAFLTKY